MAWRQKLTDLLADLLRFAIHGALLLNGIIVSIASIYVVFKVVRFGLAFLDRTIFSEPW